MKYALEINGLCKNYKDFTLDGVSFSLPSGYIMGFIGENGAGKSTTIKMILNMVKKDGGDIKIFGQDSDEISVNVREDIGVVTDECCFPETLSVNNIEKVMKLIYKNWDSKRFSELKKQFSLPDKKIVKDYSRGMKMKLSIAVALSHKPKLLLLDEATSGLDPIVRDEILDIFRDFISDENHSILISSHIISDLEKICDYVTFIHKGKIIFSEEKDVLADKYRVIKCSYKELEAIDRDKIIGVREGRFGNEALVLSEAVYKNGFESDRASIEDIMLYMVKSNNK